MRECTIVLQTWSTCWGWRWGWRCGFYKKILQENIKSKAMNEHKTCNIFNIKTRECTIVLQTWSRCWGWSWGWRWIFYNRGNCNENHAIGRCRVSACDNKVGNVSRQSSLNRAQLTLTTTQVIIVNRDACISIIQND